MHKLLIVDDSEFQRTKIESEFPSDSFTVLHGSDGLEGLKHCDEHSDIDLVICDLNMPNMNGFDMVSKIREISGYESTPILMMSTDTSMKAKEEGKARGVTGWIVKPLPEGKILPLVSKLIQRSKSA